MKDALQLWAKTEPFHALYRHMIDTGCVCFALLEKSTIMSLKSCFQRAFQDANFINTVAFIVAIHDIGKCHPSFQSKSPDCCASLGLRVPNQNSGSQYRHESGSKAVFAHQLNDFGIFGDAADAGAKVLQLHHAKNETETRINREFEPAKWNQCSKELFELMKEIFQPNLNLLEDVQDVCAFGTITWGLTILSDWIASGEQAFCEVDAEISVADYFQKSREIAKNAVDLAGLRMEKTICANEFEDLFQYLKWREMRPVQEACAALASEWDKAGEASLLTIIEAPMGEGKTEAASFLATKLMGHYSKSGIYFALPTSGTSNQMLSRIAEMLAGQGIHGVRLLHSTAWMLDDFVRQIDHEDAAAMTSFMMPLRRGLLAQYAVGTVDQVMMSVMNIRFGILRLLGAASKVIVIDEVHAYDRYMFTIIHRFLEWCRELEIPVVLLSATLPAERKREVLRIYGGVKEIAQEYPLITTAGNNGVFQHAVAGTTMQSVVELEKLAILSDPCQIAETAVDRAKGGGAVCVLMNTVDEAIGVYREIKKRTSANTILFHARFTAKRRKEIEEECLRSFGKKSKEEQRNEIVVATQVVEQSLDIDFDVMLSAIAPIDLLLQRMGRLHRHHRCRPRAHAKPQFTIFTHERSYEHIPTGFVYSPYILTETQKVLSERECVRLPEDIRSLIEAVYAESGEEDYIKRLFGEQIKESIAKTAVFPSPCKDYFFPCEEPLDLFDEMDEFECGKAVSTRLGEPSVQLLLLSSSQRKDVDLMNPERSVARDLLFHSVRVSARKIAGVEDGIRCGGLLRGVVALPAKDGNYVGSINGKRICISYDDEVGLIIE